MNEFGLIGRALIGLLLLLAAWFYGRGWTRARQADAVRKPAVWQLVAFYAGLGVIGLSFISVLEALVNRYLTARVVQHVLITGLAPLLLLASDPYDVLRTAGGRRLSLAGRPTLRRTLRGVTGPGLAWIAFVATFWLWHDHQMIAAARRSTAVHIVEVLSLLLTASLYWWHIAAARPRLHPPMPQVVRIVYAFAGMLPIKLTGFVMLFGAETMAGGVRPIGPDALTITIGNLTLADYSLAAIVLWVLGGFAYTYTAIFLAGRWLEGEDSKPPLPVSIFERDDIWVAPGLGSNNRQRHATLEDAIGD